MRVPAVVCALVAAAHVGLWAMLERHETAPSYHGQLNSVSYTPFDGSAHPDSGTRTSASQIWADLMAIGQQTRAVRTYSSTGGSELVPSIARELGLKTSIGAWIDRDPKRNARELEAVIQLAEHHPSVTSIVVGNETIYRGDQTVAELIEKIRQVKRTTSTPVTSGEIWNVWIEHPELVKEVDFIAAHILPYWEGIADTQAVDQAMRIYDKLHAAYPDKRIVIAEFGWPSAGHNRRAAVPGKVEQARVMREFVTAAEARGIEYNIIEAFDQPWKTFEGGVGPYWGMYDTSRNAKFAWSGAIDYPNYWKIVLLAVAFGVLFSIPALLLAEATVAQTALLAVAGHGVGAWLAYVFDFWQGHYFVPGAAFAFVLGTALLIPLIVTSLHRIEEIAALVLGRKPRRLIAEALPVTGTVQPMVSIHIPACREPAEMVKATLDSVARLDYPRFECIIVVNNTPDPADWRPIEEHCRQLGDRFKFICEDKLEGFKAGALRLALDATAPDAEIIGVLDADYVVTPDWLKDLVPAFSDAKVGIVQAPQDHRDGDRSVMHQVLNAEYAGFFDIGMVHRNEVNGIVVHGTMCLIRRAALEHAGSWSSDTICEDTDLGLSILEKGWTAHYTNRRYGHGLLPDTFLAFKRQRHRWAYGGLQIAKKHWRNFLPGRSALALEQKRAFGLGWVSWLGAESLGVVMAIMNLALVPFVAFVGNIVPDRVLTLPIMATFAVSLAHFLVLYSRKVNVSAGGMLGALVAAMSVQLTIARAAGYGLLKSSLPFVVTAKGGKAKARTDFPAFWEGVLGGALVGGAVLLHMTNWERVREIELFAIVLAVQSLPFLAALMIAAFEASPLNEPAVWQSAAARLLRLTTLSPSPRPAAAIERQRREPIQADAGTAFIEPGVYF